MKISLPEWKYNLPADRVAHLNAAPNAETLLALALSEVKSNVEQANLCWQAANERLGQFRAKAFVPCSPSLYDWLFNGPTGYRAHYYSSEREGNDFNQALVTGTCSELFQISRWKEFDASVGGLGEVSMRRPFSKLGFDDGAFREAPSRQLLPERWERRSAGADTMGLRAPRPGRSKLHFVGTWINREREIWIPELKSDRAKDIHDTGFA